MEKNEIKLSDLEMPVEAKGIIKNLGYVPIMMVTGKVAIVDEAYFLLNDVEENVKKVIYHYAIAINNYLKS